MGRATPPPALAVFCSPVRARSEDDFHFRADLEAIPYTEKNAISSHIIMVNVNAIGIAIGNDCPNMQIQLAYMPAGLTGLDDIRV